VTSPLDYLAIVRAERLKRGLRIDHLLPPAPTPTPRTASTPAETPQYQRILAAYRQGKPFAAIAKAEQLTVKTVRDTLIRHGDIPKPLPRTKRVDPVEVQAGKLTHKALATRLQIQVKHWRERARSAEAILHAMRVLS